MTEQEFMCRCGKHTIWVRERQYTFPCPNCGRIYVGVYDKKNHQITAKEVKLKANVLGAFYLHENGSICYERVAMFAKNPGFFNNKIVKHLWLILTTPPAPTREGQISWIFRDFLRVAYIEGAKESEILKWVKFFYESEEFSGVLKNETPDRIMQYIIKDTIEEFLEKLIKKDK